MASDPGDPAAPPLRLLWVTSEPPDHRRGGGAIRQAHLLDGLVGAGAVVDLVVAGRVADPAVSGLMARVRELPVGAPRPPRSVALRRIRDVWRAGVARTPAEVADRRAERAVLRRELRAAVGTVSGAQRRGASPPPYDVVHVEHLGLAGVVPDGLARLRSLGVQNVPSRMADQARLLAPGPRQRLLLAAEAAAARRFQRRALASTDAVAVVSAQDAADLGAGPSAGQAAGPVVVVAPNGVDTERLRTSPLPGGTRLVFTGTLDYLPNVDGIVWFCRDVLPLIRARVPDVTLDVVGRRPVAAVQALSLLPGVVLHADVPDVAAHLEAGRVTVVPVRIGTGSRVKALEAMACGRPVAATTVGLEGLELHAGHDALVADEPAALADAVVRLLTDDELARRVASAGRALVERGYRWRDIGQRFAAELGALAAQARSESR